MKVKQWIVAYTALLALACSSPQNHKEESALTHKADSLFESFYAERMKLFPLDATINGENQYNDLLPCDICDSYREKLKTFYDKYFR